MMMVIMCICQGCGAEGTEWRVQHQHQQHRVRAHLQVMVRPQVTAAAALRTARLSVTSVWTRQKMPSSVCVVISSGE